jgi:hypothetical protein
VTRALPPGAGAPSRPGAPHVPAPGRTVPRGTGIKLQTGL